MICKSDKIACFCICSSNPLNFKNIIPSLPSNQKINFQIEEYSKEENVWMHTIGYTMMTKRKAIHAKNLKCALLKQLDVVGSIDLNL